MDEDCQLHGMKTYDSVLRGHRDRWCTIPCGIQFVELMLLDIEQTYISF